MFNFTKKKKTEVVFLEDKELMNIINPLSGKACDVLLEFADRYIDNQMKQVVKQRINNPYDDRGNEETRIRGVLEFRNFFAELLEDKESQ